MIAELILAQLPEAAGQSGNFSPPAATWPLLACSIAAVTTIIMRSIALRRKNVLPLVIESEIERLVPGGSAERLARIVHHDHSALGRIVRAALLALARAAK